MSNESNCSCKQKAAYAIGIVGSFIVVGLLVWFMIEKTTPAPLGEDRIALRRKNLSDLQAANADALNNAGVLDAAKKLGRLPIEQAKAALIEEWKEPKAGRSNLIARVEKATFVPPKPPEKPSQFE
ncbi:MAG: hypothetical protein JWM68_1069 [Verrucomicrobiales bacterium]|nr:hypothetical protein [Verrucomicrobiales bacterium]